jgi:hypothetical protein
MNLSGTSLTVAFVLLLIQLLAALPWLLLVFRSPGDRVWSRRDPLFWSHVRSFLTTAGVPVLGFMLFALAGLFFVGASYLETAGLGYTFLLQLQLTIDLFIAVFVFLLRAWPKGAAVAQAAFREAVRQPLFWILGGLAFGALTMSPFVPYFTFGEDHIMVKELGYDTIMLVATVFGVLAASMSITEEIEGRTAVTLMSKPVSRRQFLLGKFAGITLAALFLFGILGCYFQGVLLYKNWWDRVDPVPPPEWLTSLLDHLGFSGDVTSLLSGIGLWIDHTIDTLPGLVLSFCQTMVLIAVAVTLATRTSMVVNLVTVLVIYFFAHLTPNLVAIGQKARQTDPNSAVAQILSFMSQLFDTLLPALQFFRISPALLSDVPPPTGPFYLYVGSVVFYGCLYTAIVLLLGLILFEDRDLA